MRQNHSNYSDRLDRLCHEHFSIRGGRTIDFVYLQRG
jgi:hypothetical protein